MNQVASIKKTFPVNTASTAEEKMSEIVKSLAPLRFEGKGHYNSTPERLFAMISEQENLHKWLAMLKRVKMDHSHSDRNAQCGVGSVRQCSFAGMGDVEENIIWWTPPHSYGFRFSPKGLGKMMMPTTDHVVSFSVESDGKGGSIFTLSTYFNWRGNFMRHMAVHMMPMMLNMSMTNLQKVLGGAGGKMRGIS